MSRESDRVEQYRKKAEDLRAAAKKLSLAARTSLLRLAEAYEKLANSVPEATNPPKSMKRK